MAIIEKYMFDWIDYLIFGGSLILSALVGLYFSKDVKKTVSSLLFGDRQLSVFPVSLSLVTTIVSGTMLLALPSEIYQYGTQMAFMGLTSTLPTLIMIYYIIPLLYNLELISLFEYMELRFSRSIRLLLSFVYTVQWLLHISVIIYGPTLALNQVTGINMEVIPPIVCLVCIIYTTMGGLKAVVWADTFQGIVMLGSVLAVIFLGLQRIGGLGEMLQTANDGGRLEFYNMNLDPTLRASFWSIMFGLFFTSLANFGTNPVTYQRFLSMPSLRQAQKCSFYLYIGSNVTFALTGLLGLILYAVYKDCDPLTTKMIKSHDQLLPLFVMNLSENFKGIPGLFVAGIISAALSTMSSGLNTISGTVYKDFIEPLFPTKPSEDKASLIMKLIVVFASFICLLLVMLVDKLGSIFQVSTMFMGTTTGIMSGIFVLGMFIPFANAKGALSGMIVSILLMTWITAGTFMALSKKLIHHPMKKMSTELCSNATILETPVERAIASDEAVFSVFRVSVFYYSFIGGITVLIIGSIVSLLTASNKDKKIDPLLLIPSVRKYLPQTGDEYESTPLEMIKA